MTTPCEKLLAEVEGWLADSCKCQPLPEPICFSCEENIYLETLAKIARCAVKALDTAIYDLERIRDANWEAEQMRMGARSGAHVANEAREEVNRLAGNAP